MYKVHISNIAQYSYYLYPAHATQLALADLPNKMVLMAIASSLPKYASDKQRCVVRTLRLNYL